MKLLLLFFLFSVNAMAQSFGASKIEVSTLPSDLREMEFYKWYQHPEENNIYIKNFQTSLYGFMLAFSETQKMLSENHLELSKPAMDASQFHPDIKEFASQEALHLSIADNKSKILRTWSVNGHYLSLLLRNDVYMILIGDNTTAQN